MDLKRRERVIRVFIVFSLAFTFQFVAFSQNQKSDSLIALYNSSMDDAEKLTLAKRIFYQNFNRDSSIFLKYSKEAIRCTERLNKSFEKAKILLVLGYFYSERDVMKAYDYANDALQIFSNLDSLSHKSQAYTLLGTINYYYGNYPKAFENYFESLKINERLMDVNSLAVDYNNLAIIYSEQKNYQKALEYYFKALDINKKNNQKGGYVNNLMNISIVYGGVDSIEKQYRYGKEALDASRKSNYDLAQVLLNMGDIYVKVKEFQQAEQCFLEAEQLLIKQGSNYYINYLYFSFGDLYKAKNDLEPAIRYYKLSLANAEKDKMQALIRDCCKALSSIYKEKKNYQESLHYHEIYHNASDSIHNIDNSKKIIELELQYKFDKQLEVKKREEENKQKLLLSQRKIIIFFIVAMVLALSLIFLIVKNFRSQRKLNKLLFEQNNYIQAQSNELRVQRDQLKQVNATKDKLYSIIAHDLKNPFNVLMGFSSLLVERWSDIDEKRKIQYIDLMNKSANNAFDLLSNLLDWARSQTGKLKIEPRCVEVRQIVDEAILFVANNAKAKKISLNTNVDTSLYIMVDRNMISTVLRNIISNSIKFTNENGKVLIYCTHENDQEIAINIEDNGIGMSEELLSNLFSIENHSSSYGTSNEKGTGLGLILCKEFVTKNNGRINVKSELGVGSTFSIILPTC